MSDPCDWSYDSSKKVTCNTDNVCKTSDETIVSAENPMTLEITAGFSPALETITFYCKVQSLIDNGSTTRTVVTNATFNKDKDVYNCMCDNIETCSNEKWNCNNDNSCGFTQSDFVSNTNAIRFQNDNKNSGNYARKTLSSLCSME